jgi:hydroxyethylthiazole kinase-like sugar kinase family protein
VRKSRKFFNNSVHSPLVHCMTNDVVQTFTANVLLALGRPRRW